MVKGIDSFRSFFAGDEDKYVLIGGAACDAVFESNDAEFRATRDLDLVLLVETLTPEFGQKFWDYIVAGGYQNKATSSGKPQFFRFTDPRNEGYPKMIELFARTEFELAYPGVLTPIHVDDEISSLSAILLDDDYYRILLEGKTVIDGLSVLRPEYLVLFKAKAYLDLKKKREEGWEIHSSEYKKHKRDILRIASELLLIPTGELPESVRIDMRMFLDLLNDDPFDKSSLLNYRTTTEKIAAKLSRLYFG